MRSPTVSVCIPTFNRASMLRDAIESVRSQTFEDYEIIISDNASTDETEAVVRSYTDRRIRYHVNARNIGARDNFNRAFGLASGRFIAPLSDDDLMLTTNLAQKVGMFLENPSVGLVHSKFHVIDQTGHVIHADTNWSHGPDRFADAVEPGDQVLRLMLLTYNRINLPTVVFRRECYERFGGFSNQLVLNTDWAFWMKIAAYYDIGFLATPLVKWRIHPSSFTSQAAYASDHRLSALRFKEELLTKRLVLRQEARRLPAVREVSRQVWSDIATSISGKVDELLEGSTARAGARAFLADVFQAIPEALRYKVCLKALLKVILPSRALAALKRVLPS